MRAPLVCTLFLATAASSAHAQTCDPAYPGACVHPSAVVDASATILPGADVGAFAVVGPSVNVAGVVAERATLIGRVSGALTQPFGMQSVLSRNSLIGADADIGDDVVIGRSVTVGTDLIAGDLSTIGYGTSMGNGTTLGPGAAVGTLVTVGDNVTIDGVVARDAVVGNGSDISGIVGPNVTIGSGAIVAGRVRKDAIIADDAEIDAGARVGRGASIGRGAILGNNVNVGTHAVVPDCAWLPGPEVVGNGQTWSGNTFVPGCVPSTPGAPDVIRFTTPSGGVTLYNMTYDASGNLYAVGSFFGDASVNGNLEHSPVGGQGSGFVAKFDSQNNVVWYTPVSSTNSAELYAIALSGNDVYVGGRYRGQATVGSVTLPYATNEDLIAAKVSAVDGTVAWANAAQTTRYGNLLHAVATPTGVTFAGNYNGVPTFGSTPALPTTTGNDYDIVLAGMDTAGNWTWTASTGLSDGDSVVGLHALPNGNLVTALNIRGFGKTSPSNIAPGLVACTSCAVVAVVSATGSPVAHHQMTTASNFSTVGGITAMGTRIFATGSILGSGLSFAGQTLVPSVSGSSDLAVFEYTSNAIAVEAWTTPTVSGSTQGQAITHDGASVYTAFMYTGTTQLAGTSLTLPTPSATHGFSGVGVAELDVNGGAWMWAKGSHANSGSFPSYSPRRLQAYSTGPATELSLSTAQQSVTDYAFDGVVVPFASDNGAAIIRTAAGASWQR